MKLIPYQRLLVSVRPKTTYMEWCFNKIHKGGYFMSRQNPFMRSTGDRYCNSCQNGCQNNCNDQQSCCDGDKDKNPCVVCPPGPVGPQGAQGKQLKSLCNLTICIPLVYNLRRDTPLGASRRKFDLESKPLSIEHGNTGGKADQAHQERDYNCRDISLCLRHTVDQCCSLGQPSG